MSTESITYGFGGVELLDMVQPLWEKLNQHHAEISPHFSAKFQSKNFDGRKSALLEKYADGEIRIDIAQSNGAAIGYLISAVSLKGVGEIESIYVEESFRGQAIGDELMRRALAWLDERNVHTKVIAVAVGNEWAYAFYERYDFFPRVMILKQKDTL
jgi:ribosomal protein S18 acetylase RimI-like enzyme